MQAAMKNILLIDDDKELTQLLCDYLQGNDFVVTVENDGANGLATALKRDFDLILLDVMLPNLNGFELLQQFRTQKTTPVIMLTAKGDDFDRIFGLEVGADDYIAKPFNHRELLARVKALVRRVDLLTQKTHSEKLVFEEISLCLQSRSVRIDDHLVDLTGTEFEILHLLMMHPTDIVSKEDISQQVLGRRLAPYDRSIDMHVSNIRKKIAVYCVHERIKTVRGSGYVLVGNN
jgi:two-component system, OmpR family, response regulator CpxR